MILDTVDEKKGVHTRYLILLIILLLPPLTTPIVQRCLLLVPKWQRVAVKCGFDGLHLLRFWLGLLADANPRRLAA